LLTKTKILEKLISNSKIARAAGRNFTGKKTVRGRGYKNKKKKKNH